MATQLIAPLTLKAFTQEYCKGCPIERGRTQHFTFASLTQSELMRGKNSMPRWCEFHVGFNSGSLVDLVTEKSVGDAFEPSDRDFDELHEEWIDSGYGFCTPMNFENEHADKLFELGDEIDADDYVNPGSDGEIYISSEHPHLKLILDALEALNTHYYDDKQNSVPAGKFRQFTNTESIWTLTICELESPH